MKQYDLLIVDDEKRFADMLAKRLSLRGCHCEVCYNGRQALDMVGRKTYFLILLDLHLPDIYGVEVLKGIKSISTKTPVIILTGHGTEKDRRACMQQGAYAFVHKPLGIDKLIRILAQIEETSP
jgi:DNA-binding NtrC family response regulator